MTYIAEDVPWYMVDRSVDRPWRDEDIAMSAPQTIYRGDSWEMAIQKMAIKLLGISAMDHVITFGRPEMYVSAADFFLQGGDGVRISGRYYRIREV